MSGDFKACEGCGRDFFDRKGWRFCIVCRRSKKWHSNFFRPTDFPTPPRRTRRPAGRHEDEDDPGFEDAVRRLEDAP